MRGSTLLVVAVAGTVVVAAVVSGVRGSGGDSPDAAPPAVTTAEAPPATAPAIPVGDVRRLPPLEAGVYTGRLFGFTEDLCGVVVTDLTDFKVTNPAGVASVCTVWPSPGGVAMAARRPPPEDAAVIVAPVIDGRSDETGVDYIPGRRSGALTVADDGSVAVCDGASVRLARAGRVQTVRTLTPVDGQFDEQCVTGAVGKRIVQLGDDRTSLVDVATRKVVRRLEQPVPGPVVAITSSADGAVIVADLADGPPFATVFDEAGKVRIPRRAIGQGVSIRKLLLAKGGGAVAVQSSRGWEVTNLLSGKRLTAPGGATVNDVSFSPDGGVVAMATRQGIVFAGVTDLTPKLIGPQEYQALVWLP